MTREKDRQRALAARPGTQTYEVGYAKPPAHSRFQPVARAIRTAAREARETGHASLLSTRSG